MAAFGHTSEINLCKPDRRAAAAAITKIEASDIKNL